MLYRHWTLYDSMWHSQYIATRLGIWKEQGQKVGLHFPWTERWLTVLSVFPTTS